MTEHIDKQINEYCTLIKRVSLSQKYDRCESYHILSKYIYFRASLVAQLLRICLPMQGTRVRALVWEDPTCRGATRPVSHSY